VAAGAGGGAALAAPTDRAEAEGLLLSGGGAVNVDAIAELDGAYSSFPPAEAVNAPLSAAALDLLQLTVGGQVIPGSQVLAVGGVGQYSSSDVGGAYAASGLLTADGAIAVGPGGPGQNTVVNLAPVLDALGLEAVASMLSVELGAVAASAEAQRTAGGVTTVGDYQIASGVARLTSPVVSDTAVTVGTTLDAASATLNGVAAPGGAIDDAVGGILDDLDAIISDLLPLGLADLVDPTVTTTLDVDLGAAAGAVLDDTFVSGPVTLNLATGAVTIDLAQVYGGPGGLNDLPVNTELLSDAAANPVIAQALSDILTVQLPAALGTVLTDTLNSTALDITINAGVDALGGSIGVLNITVDGTVGGILALPGSTAPTVSLAGTSILGLPVGDLLGPVTDLVVDTLLPAVGDVLAGVFDLDTLEAGLTSTLTGLVTDLNPVLGVVGDVISVTVNVQETPGDFRDPLGTDAGSFTQRAATLSIASGLIELNLASATVRAVPLAAPTGLAIDPVRGPVTGGTPVTITGTNLTGTSEVLFGTVPATPFTVSPDGTSITTTAPAQAAPGPVVVTVTNPDGSGTTAFEYFNVASVDEITPDSGSTLGGDEITITGECFTGATGVTFGGVAGVDFEVVSDTEITVTTPPGAAGSVPVVITNPTDCGDVTVPDGFTYVVPGAPVLTDIVPDRGPETGGTTVTITGDDFTGTTSVTFDGVEAEDFTVVSDTEITAITPPGTPGIVDVIVTNGAGASAPLDFEFFDVTEIDSVTPAEGPEAGGDDVVITGDCFTGATNVLFGTTPATSFVVVSDTVITAVTPAGVGVVDVTVVGAGDCGPGTIDDGYEYFAPPVVTDLDPTEGPESGGTPVTITGEGFTGTTGVTFGGEPAEFEVIDDETIEAVSPGGAPGTVTVEIEHPGGDVEAGEFEYLNEPSVTTVDPRTGPEDGGTLVTITGEGFTGSTGVTFGGVAGTEFDVVDDTTITVLTPAGAPATVPIVVENPVADAAAGDFTYVAGTEVTGITPGSGPEDGGNTVTIAGVCFTGATGVTFGGVPATSFTVVNDTTITAVVPAGTPGTVDVTVVGAAACGTDSLPDGYEYIAKPTVTAIDPTEGPETGDTLVTIEGDGFTGTTGVLFGANPGTIVTTTDNEITVRTPAGTPGDVTVTVQHPGGDVEAGIFEYLNVPGITSLDPDEGPEDGGTVVTIIGEGFDGATGVTFDGEDGVDFEVVSDTEITVTTPAHAPATVPVVVLHPNGDSAAASFTYIEGTEIDTVTPPGGPEEGGTVVTLTGQCFTGATDVLFGTTSATSFTVDSDTQITAVAPAGVGVVDVTVVGSATCGTDTVPDGFEYTDDPVIGTITPTTGPETGGTVVTITGSNFDGVTAVTFDGVPGTALTVVSDTELRVTTPAGTPGTADVVVTSPDGSGDPGAFLYYPITVVDGSNPGTGPTGGGTVVTITGRCFTGATGVLFGGVAAAEFRVISDTTITAVTPRAATAGTVTLTVTGAGTCGTGSLPGGFTYVPGPAAGGVLPATGGEATGFGPLAALGLMLLAGGGAIATAIRIRRRTV
jgi:hypothetical protein